jgi:hypothetical protein
LVVFENESGVVVFAAVCLVVQRIAVLQRCKGGGNMFCDCWFRQRLLLVWLVCVFGGVASTVKYILAWGAMTSSVLKNLNKSKIKDY